MTQTTPRPSTTADTQLDRNARREHLRSKGWTPRPTLHGADYTSDAVYAEERERVWFDGWICIGRDEEIPKPGDFLVRDIVGESVIVTRNQAGELRAFYNVCAHRGTKLLDETGSACGHVSKAFKCPYHAWSYDLDGQLVGTPNVHEDEQFDRESYPLYGDRRRVIRRVHLRQPLGRAGAAGPGPDRGDGEHHQLRPLQARRAAHRRAAALRGGRELEDRRRELQRVPALPDGPSGARLDRAAVPLRRGVGRGDPGRRQLDDRRRDELHQVRPVRAAAAPRARARRLPHVLRHVPVPEPAAEPASGLRDVLPAPAAGAGAHHGHLGVPVPARDHRVGDVQAGAGRGAVGPHLQAGLDRSASEPRPASGHGPTRPASTRARTASCSTSTSATAR